MLNDLRYAMRSLLRSKGFVALVLGSLTLALGLNTTVYAIIDAVSHPYVPYRDPERLVRILFYGDAREQRVRNLERYRLIREGVDVFEDMALYTGGTGVIAAGAEGVNGSHARVSSNYLSMLGVRPILGRVFSLDRAAEDENGVVLSYGLWQRLFPGSRTLDGTSVTIDGQAYTVIGVMPSEMAYRGTTFWTAIPPGDMQTGRTFGRFFVYARLNSLATEDRARAALNLIGDRLKVSYGAVEPAFGFDIEFVTQSKREFQPVHFALAGCGLLVLLIACTNIANLMLARGTARRREVALRYALGASRHSIVRQLFAESVILAIGGGVLGVVSAIWGIDILLNRMPPAVELLGIFRPHLSWRVLAFGFLATGVTGLLFGLIPAWRVSMVDVNEPLKESGGSTTGRIRNRYSPLVMAEAGLALVLLVSAGLLIKAVGRVSAFDFGYDPRGLLQIRADIYGYRDSSTLIRWGKATSRLNDIMDRLARIEGVRSVASYSGRGALGRRLTSDVMGTDTGWVYVSGYTMVTPNYLRTLGLPIVAGRDFEPGDAEGPGAVIVDEVAARRLWPSTNPVGRLIKLGSPRSDLPWLRVVGVTRRMLEFEPDPFMPPGPPEVFVAGLGMAGEPGSIVRRYFGGISPVVHFVVRVSGDPAETGQRLARELWTSLQPIRYPFVGPMSREFQDMVASRRFLALVFVACGAFALVLAAVGLYGVVAYTVSRRMREFAVRMALGASGAHVFKIVLHDGFVMALAGTGIGAFAAMFTGQVLGDWLYDVHFADWMALAGAETALLSAAFLACVAPARRAMKADPVEILRAV